jgi:ATP-dependent helicase STH1/SNF2
VRILRLVTSKSIEENILQRAQYKLDLDGKVIQAGKFDNKTSDREREELLRTLLGGDEDEEEEKAEREGEIEDNELNEIIARNEEELEWYNTMDRERLELESASWKTDKRSNNGTLPLLSRLMQDAELPDVLLVDVNAPDEIVAEIPTGRGARARKEVVYNDVPDDQFLNTLDEGNVNDYIDRKNEMSAKRKEAKSRREEDHRRRRAAGEDVDSDADAYDDVPEDPHDLPDPDEEALSPSSKGPGKRLAFSSEAPKKKKGAKPKKLHGVDPDMPDTFDPQTRANLTKIFLSCFHAVETNEVSYVDENGQE